MKTTRKFSQNNKIILKLQQQFKSKICNVFTEEVNTTELSSNDDKRLQAFDGITSNLYGANARKVCNIELLQYLNTKRLVLIIIPMKKSRT